MTATSSYGPLIPRRIRCYVSLASVEVGHWVAVTDSCGHVGLDYILYGHDLSISLCDAVGATCLSGELYVCAAGYGRGGSTVRSTVASELDVASGTAFALTFYF